MTKKEEKLIVDALSEMSVQAVDMGCPKKYTYWLSRKIKELISALGLESEWDKAFGAKSAELLRKKVVEETTDPIAKAIGMMFADILARIGDDEEEEDDE